MQTYFKRFHATMSGDTVVLSWAIIHVDSQKLPDSLRITWSSITALWSGETVPGEPELPGMAVGILLEELCGS